MTKAIANPIQALIAQAAKTLPATTGETQRLATQPATVIVADLSDSMSEPAWGGHRRVDLLREAVEPLLRDGRHQLVTFGTHAEIATRIGTPSGSTQMHKALQLAGTLKARRVLVISDGEPDSEHKALDAAAALNARIDVLYIGPESNATAKAFMARLARANGGRSQSVDLAALAHQPQALPAAIRGMLGGLSS